MHINGFVQIAANDHAAPVGGIPFQSRTARAWRIRDKGLARDVPVSSGDLGGGVSSSFHGKAFPCFRAS